MGHRRMTVVPAGHDVQLAILCRSIGVVLEIIRVTGGGGGSYIGIRSVIYVRACAVSEIDIAVARDNVRRILVKVRRGELRRTDIIPSNKVRLRRSCLRTLNLEFIVEIDVSVVLIASTRYTCAIDIRPASRHKVDQTVRRLCARIVVLDRQLLRYDIACIRKDVDVVFVSSSSIPCTIGIKLYVVQRLNLQSTAPRSTISKCFSNRVY